MPITVRDGDSALADAGAAKAAGADLVELRVDEFFHGGARNAESPEEREIVRIVSECPLPCIVTCRPVSEGGVYDGDDMSRVALFERLGTAFGTGEHPPRYIDVELATYTRSANIRQKIGLAIEHPEQVRDLTTSLILSLHDFRERPADLTRRVLAMRDETAARVHKIAYRARSLRDNLELFELLEGRDRPTIALGMGEFGLMSRVLAPKFGGFLTFASLRAETVTAPGQPTIRDLLGTYRFRSIGPGTGVYGVVGWPVSHSLSPLVHNAGFEAVGVDAVYLPMPIPGARLAKSEEDPPAHADSGPADLEASYLSLKATLLELLDHAGLSLRGVSVTIPHKENLLRLARERGWMIEDGAQRIGAANTLIAARDAAGRLGQVRVINTDAPAIAECLAAAGPLRPGAIGVIGAGGVARAAAYALASAGTTVEVYNRTPDRAAALAEDLAGLPGRVAAAAPGAMAQSCCSGYINCTPIGMSGGPSPNESPLPAGLLRSLPADTVVMDTVYNPVRTPLLRNAAEARLRTVDGVGVFVSQAERQFRAWTGSEAPRGLFERIAREHVVNPRSDAEPRHTRRERP